MKAFPLLLPINGGNYDISMVTVQLNLKEASSEALVLLAWLCVAAGGVCTERQLLPQTPHVSPAAVWAPA